MSAQPNYPTPLRAERGGLAPAIDLPRPRMTPAEIPLTLSADVLRLPYPPATRLVLAEIVSLYAANAGCCDASDKHFADRLTISTDTASRAVQQLEADGLLSKEVLRLPTGFYRTLVPNLAAIVAKAETNPYPQNAGSTPQNAGRESTRKMRVGYPQNAGSPTRKMPVALPAKCGSNTPFNIPSNFQVNPTPSADASAVVVEKKIEVVSASTASQRPASRTRGAAGRAQEPEHFAPFWQAWPKKEKRQDALAAFAKLSPDDQAAAASRADTWLAAHPDLADPTRYRFIPLATSWLNQARWTDQAAPLTANPTAHASANPTSYPAGRPGAGAKPTQNATELAGSLARRRFQQRAGSPGDSR